MKDSNNHFYDPHFIKYKNDFLKTISTVSKAIVI